ncbi:hypothetical protein [Sulfurimonas sp. NW15]|uniref:hypothetical protein n=1 Tax=unclassified Sulfurimonas TaxID=2623549 RepID=UPI003DA94E03
MLIPLSFINFFGTQTSVWAESGRKVAAVGTEVPIPKNIHVKLNAPSEPVRSMLKPQAYKLYM